MNDEENKTANSNSTAAASKLKITEYIVSDDTPFLSSSIQIKVYAFTDHFYLNDFISDIDHPPQL